MFIQKLKIHMNKNIQLLFAILFCAASLGRIEGAVTDSAQTLIDAPDEKRKKAASISAEGVYELVHQSSQLPQPLCMLIKQYAAICCPHEFFKLPIPRILRAKMDDFFPPDSLQYREFALSLAIPKIALAGASSNQISTSGMYRVNCIAPMLDVYDTAGLLSMRIDFSTKYIGQFIFNATAINNTHVAALVYLKENNKFFISIWRIGNRNPEHRLHIPLQQVPDNVWDIKCKLSLSVIDSDGSYHLAAFLLSQHNTQQNIVYRWKLQGVTVHEFTPVTFEVDSSSNQRSWSEILDTGDWYATFGPHYNYVIKLPAGEACIQKIDSRAGAGDRKTFLPLTTWKHRRLLDMPYFTNMPVSHQVRAYATEDFTTREFDLILPVVHDQEYKELKTLISYFITPNIHNDWCCVVHNPNRTINDQQQNIKIFFAHVPRWLLVHADALMRLYERIAPAEEQGITTEDSRKAQVDWEQLPQRDQELLNSAPSLVRTLVVEKLRLKGVPDYPCITGTLDDPEETREAVQRRYLQDQEEAQKALKFWKTCYKTCCSIGATVEPTNAPITTPSPTPHMPPAPLHNAIRPSIAPQANTGAAITPRRSQSIPTRAPSPQKRSWRSIVGYTLVGATSAYCVYRGIRSKIARKTKAIT